MEKLRKISLNTLALKIIGWVLAAAGGIGMVFLPEGTANTVFQMIFRAGMLIFAFLAVEGFQHTGNLERYIVTIAAAALVTEPFYDYACLGVWLDFSSANGQNPLFALALGLVQLYFLRYMGVSSVGKILKSLVMVLAACLWMFLLNVHWGVYTVLAMAVFYLLREKKTARNLVMAAVSLPWFLIPAVGLLPLWRYNGERGNFNKYLFYVLCPVVWLVLALIRLLAL